MVRSLQELKSKPGNAEIRKTAVRQTKVFIGCCVKEAAPHLCSNHFQRDKKQWSFKNERGGGLVQCSELQMLGTDLGCGKDERGL